MTGMEGINSLATVLSSLNVNDTAPAAATQARTSATEPSSAAAAGTLDRASFSASGLAAQTTDTSDVRLTKVAELRNAIANGTYSVPATAVADKMVEGLLS